MKKVGRINLTFNLENPEDKRVYDYFQTLDKTKTVRVVEAITKTFLSEFYWENYIIEKDCALAERIIERMATQKVSIDYEDAKSQKLLSEVLQKLDEISEEIKNRPIVINSNESISNSVDSDNSKSFDEDVQADDDAFNSLVDFITTE